MGKREKNEQETEQLHILEEYAATVEGALQIDSKAPFQYGGLATQEALIQIQESLETLEKKAEWEAKPVSSVSHASKAL